MAVEASSVRIGPRMRLVFAAVLIGLVYALVEGVAYLAYRPITGESYAARPPEQEAVAVESPDVKPGREKAGLGFKDPAMSLHPYLGYVYTPPAPGAEPGRVPVSPDGFLDTAGAVRKRDESRLLVGILGGSVAGQLGTWHSERLREALQSRPALRGKPVEFVKLGLPGYHQPQQVIQLAYVLAQGGEFDLVLNLDGFNEVAVPGALNVPQGEHPLYPMNWSMVALDVPDPQVRRHVGAVEYLQGERARRAAAFETSWRSWSPLSKLLWKREDQRMQASIAEHTWALQEIPLEEVPYFVKGPEGALDPPGGLVPWCVDVWKECSLQLKALCDAQGIRYLHFLQPNQYLPGSKPLSSDERKNAYEDESPYRAVVEEGYPLLRAAGSELAAAGVEFHDLSLAFENVDETLYVDNCCHFNAEGNQILSEAIAAVVAP